MNGLFCEKLSRVLINYKFCSERSVSTFFKNNQIFVNHIKITDSGFMVDSGTDEITINEKSLEKSQNHYYLMNKPKGFVCSTTSDSHKTVYSLFSPELLQPENLGKLHSVGRLDCDTTGLLLFTTNGNFSHILSNPKSDIKKKYYVKLEKEITEKDFCIYTQKCKKGIFIKEEKKSPSFISKPSELEWISKNECFITVTEGKFHEVKRIFNALGNSVIELERKSMGCFILEDSLKPGEYRHLTNKEIAQCKELF